METWFATPSLLLELAPVRTGRYHPPSESRFSSGPGFLNFAKSCTRRFVWNFSRGCDLFSLYLFPPLPFFLSFFPFPPRRGIYRLGINPWKTDVATVVPLLSMPLVFRPVSGDPFFMPETHESRTRATRNASRDDRAINLRICK